MPLSNKQCCENCKYFIKHYVKKNLKFIRTNYGHCAKSFFKCRNNNSSNFCEAWEKQKNNKVKTKNNVKQIMLDMHKKLDEISIFISHN